MFCDPFPLPPPHAVWKMHPPIARKMRQNTISFLRFDFCDPLVPRRIAGIAKPSAKSPFHGVFSPGSNAACGPVVLSVSVDVPAFETEFNEQVGAGETAGVMLQARLTVEGLRPPAGVIVTVDVADAPGATDTDDGDAASPNPRPVIWMFTAGDVLSRKSVSPS